MDLPIHDNHVHLDPRGDQLEAVARFSRAGGTSLTLVHKPYPTHPVTDADDWGEAYEVTLGFADRIREETDVGVLVAVGPHPAEFTRLAEDWGIDEAERIYEAGLDLARDLVADGRADAIGEVGRPHWEVDDAELMEACNRLFVAGLERAADVDRPAILHTEPATVESLEDFVAFAEEAGLAPERLVNHYAPPLVKECETRGIWPSVIADRDDLEAGLEESSRLLMETDYLDDPDRPGAVKGIRTVPRRTKSLHEDGLLDEAAWRRVHRENVVDVYEDAATPLFES